MPRGKMSLSGLLADAKSFLIHTHMCASTHTQTIINLYTEDNVYLLN